MDQTALTFYTNIPTPYQLSFFDELSKHFKLTVVYYSAKENNRSWNFTLEAKYRVIVLKNNMIARFVQRWVTDFHFSWKIFKVGWCDQSKQVIVGGNYWIPNATFIFLISKLRKKKVAYFSEPLFRVPSGIKYAIKWTYLRILNVCCDAIFCVGKKSVETFNEYGIRKPKFIVRYNIDTGKYTDLEPGKIAALRQEFKSNGELIILSSGALIERKGMDVLIEAVKQIKCKNLRLLIIGDGPQKETLERLCAQDGRILLAGFKDPAETPYFFAIADIFAFATRYDGWAVVINEAIAARVPVVSSDQAGAAVDLITSPDLGILCRSENVEDFSQALGTLIHDKEKRDIIRKNAARLIPLISSEYNAKYVKDLFTQAIL